MKNNLVIFTGSANPALARRVCEYLNIPLGDASVGRFPDGEVEVKVLEDVRGADVYIIQSTSPPTNDNLLELLILMDSLKRASAAEITAVIPYFGYARQDRKAEGRVPITAKLVANLLTTAGAHRVLAMDLHAPQIQGFFDIPMDHLFAAPVLVEHLRKLEIADPVVLAPDVGGIKMARAYAKRVGGDLAVVDKRRKSHDQTEVLHLIGEVRGRSVILVDDMISTGTTAAEAIRTCREQGAREVYLCATHAIFTEGAAEKVRATEPKQVIVTDTIPVKPDILPKLKVLSVASLLGEAIQRIHRSESVSALFV